MPSSDWRVIPYSDGWYLVLRGDSLLWGVIPFSEGWCPAQSSRWCPILKGDTLLWGVMPCSEGWFLALRGASLLWGVMPCSEGDSLLTKGLHKSHFCCFYEIHIFHIIYLHVFGTGLSFCVWAVKPWSLIPPFSSKCMWKCFAWADIWFQSHWTNVLLR